jgi:hypothetical protein
MGSNDCQTCPQCKSRRTIAMNERNRRCKDCKHVYEPRSRRTVAPELKRSITGEPAVSLVTCNHDPVPHHRRPKCSNPKQWANLGECEVKDNQP